MNNKEQKFYSILQDLFVGAKLEGDSGYVNLMNIKTEYFKKIEKNLKAEVKKKFSKEEPEDLYDKLYTFFDSYISDGGAIFFSSTPVYKNIYSKVYSDREDTALFWKTAKLYYVKSEANYKSIENLQLHGEPEIAFDFQFDASLLKHKQANEKKELEFYFTSIKSRKGKKVVKFHVLYKNDNKYTVLEKKLKVKGKDAVIKSLFNDIKKLPSGIILKNEGIDLASINLKGDKRITKAEFIISENKNNKVKIKIAPAIVGEKEIEKYLRLRGVNLSEEEIQKAYRVYKKQTEIDYFIHKDAKGFLREQFDLYIYQHLANDLDSLFEQEDLNRIKKIKEIAYQTIEYIGNFEDELKKMWLKPKFARNSNYVVTLDRIADKDGGIAVIKKIFAHKNIKEQIKEWEDLGIVEKDFDKKEVLVKEKLSDEWNKLPIDTKYFKDLEIDILGLFDNLDEELDGRLIKSDNFQALNTLLPKYKGEVQTIYIDPPFNLGENADFNYLVNYKDSTWATILENRIRIAYNLLKDTGSIFVRCDYNGNHIVRMILDDIFGKDSFKNEIILNKSNQQGEMELKFNPATDFLFLYSFGKINPLRKKVVRQSEQWLEMHSPKQNINSHLVQFNGIKFIVPRNRHWTFSQKKIDLMISDNRIRIVDKEYIDVYGNRQSKMLEYRLSDTTPIDSNWTDITGYSSTTGFSTENSEILLKRVIKSTTKEGDLVLDFFAGSATTQAVSQKLGRKWIGVEMGQQFFNVDLPRLKKVISGKQNGISKDLKEKYNGSGIFKYEELEQYEEALKKAVYKPNEKKLENIDFSLSEKQAKDGMEIDFKKEKARFTFEKLYPDVDIAETISNLEGKKIKKILKDKVIFEDDSEIDLNNLDFEKHKNLQKLIYW